MTGARTDVRPSGIGGQRTLLLVRHGLPDYQTRLPADEPPGPPLSSVGVLQARQAAGAVRCFPVQTVYASPLARAWQTAEHLAAALGVRVRIESELKEWHRTEGLYEVSERSARWLGRWLRGFERCAAVVGHASPLLAVLRTALYLPHVGWHHPGRPDRLQVSSADRFEFSMGAVFAVTFDAREVTARLVAHPEPRIVDAQCGPWRRRFPRPVVGGGENTCVRRPNLTHLTGG